MFRKRHHLTTLFGFVLLIFASLELFEVYLHIKTDNHVAHPYYPLSELTINISSYRTNKPISKSLAGYKTVSNHLSELTINITSNRTNKPSSRPLTGYKTVSGSCKEIRFPHELFASDRWQKVDPENSAYVFSAYHEGNAVKIIGVVMSSARSMTCQLWYKSDESSTLWMVTVPAAINKLPEGYTACLFTCMAVWDRNNATLMAVSISKTECFQPLNVVPVTQKGHSRITNKFTVCVTPFSNNYARAYELIEWIELNKLLGADKFIFYNYSSASNVERALRSYSDIGLVEVVDWKLPMRVPTWPDTGNEGIHYVGQLASLNECLLRSKGRSEFLVNVDLDEFIIPREENVTTWEKMLDKIPTASAYFFANVFFRKEWNTSRTNFTGYADADKYRLVTLLRLQHEKQIWNYGQRSKYIVRPKDINVLGIHFIWSQTGSSQKVPHGVALLHHYRNWMKYGDKQERIEDDIVVKKFKDNLLRNVKDKWETLPGLIYDIPLCEKPRDFGAC